MWLCSALLVLFSACCGPDNVQKQKVVDTFIHVPADTVSLSARPSTSYADTVKGDLTLRITKSGSDQYQDTIQALNRQYKQRIRQLTDKPCPEIQDALLLETTLYQRRIQRLRDSLVTIRATAQRRADSIRVVKQQTLEHKADKTGSSLIATLFWVIIGAFTLTGLYSLFTMISGKE